ncbi:hypothetical protein OIE66_01640 [Nonomuraea sp. NBC_01738]|uniref:hypothetical protein n=1 Tax=Nonomuraea sp. NBC_01738 TaxID=2976003 RepID=UPI002E0D8E4A|nr:hypothetical protein OIE66_01640 [Nonomuraea sp. NBC_01738]
MTTPDQYAQAVREALAGHPDREELLEDLDDHLAEIAAESDIPLEERLGSPAAYAEELAAAYGGRPEGTRRGRRLTAALTGLRAQPVYRSVAAFLPELRPGWWVLRGYALTMLLLSLAGEGRIVPQNPVDLLFVVLGVLASIWYGKRTKGRVLVGLAMALNVAAGIGVFAGFVEASSTRGGEDGGAIAFVSQRPANVLMVSSGTPGSSDIYNIKPYAKDGTPLNDVYLYDQDGQPITTSPGEHGFEVDTSCGAPVLNRYPLPLREITERPFDGQDRTAVPSPTPCPTATTPPVPPVSESPTPKASSTR